MINMGYFPYIVSKYHSDYFGNKRRSLSAEYGTKMTTSESRHAKDSDGIYSEMSTLAHVDAVTQQNELLVFPWINFNAV